MIVFKNCEQNQLQIHAKNTGFAKKSFSCSFTDSNIRLILPRQRLFYNTHAAAARRSRITVRAPEVKTKKSQIKDTYCYRHSIKDIYPFFAKTIDF